MWLFYMAEGKSTYVKWTLANLSFSGYHSKSLILSTALYTFTISPLVTVTTLFKMDTNRT